MSDEVVKLIEQVMDLPAADRRVLTEHLTEAVEAEEAADELWADPEFREEIERRMAFVLDHPEQLLDGQQVLDELRARYQRTPAP